MNYTCACGRTYTITVSPTPATVIPPQEPDNDGYEYGRDEPSAEWLEDVRGIEKEPKT